MFYHLVFDGVAEGPLGVALDIVDAASRLVRSGAATSPGDPSSLDQKVVSVDGAPVRSAIGRPVAVDAALSSMSPQAPRWLTPTSCSRCSPMSRDRR